MSLLKDAIEKSKKMSYQEKSSFNELAYNQSRGMSEAGLNKTRVIAPTKIALDNMLVNPVESVNAVPVESQDVPVFGTLSDDDLHIDNDTLIAAIKRRRAQQDRDDEHLKNIKSTDIYEQAVEGSGFLAEGLTLVDNARSTQPTQSVDISDEAAPNDDALRRKNEKADALMSVSYRIATLIGTAKEASSSFRIFDSLTEQEKQKKLNMESKRIQEIITEITSLIDEVNTQPELSAVASKLLLAKRAFEAAKQGVALLQVAGDHVNVAKPTAFATL